MTPSRVHCYLPRQIVICSLSVCKRLPCFSRELRKQDSELLLPPPPHRTTACPESRLSHKQMRDEPFKPEQLSKCAYAAHRVKPNRIGRNVTFSLFHEVVEEACGLTGFPGTNPFHSISCEGSVIICEHHELITWRSWCSIP